MGAMRQGKAEKALYSFQSVSVRSAVRGEVTERPMVLAWKAGVVNATRGSNPRLSAILKNAKAAAAEIFSDSWNAVAAQRGFEAK
jgi:hypothetical protein